MTFVSEEVTQDVRIHDIELGGRFRNGSARLIPAKEAHDFAERYVATSILGKRFHLNSGSLARYLRQSGTALLAIPLSDAGHAFFLHWDVTAQIQLPGSSMLKEQAQRCIRPPKGRVGRIQTSEGSRLG
jgi:hypothetical protein